MSGNSSATGGYLRQLNPVASPTEWDDAITAAIVGITGLPSNLVRPRWQPYAPNQPEATADWCAVGITSRTPTDYPSQWLTDEGMIQTRWYEIEALASFYGPNYPAFAEMFRDGLYVQQNLEALAQSGLRLKNVGTSTSVPEQINSQWIPRVDLPITLSGVIDRTYNVLDILSSDGTITTDSGPSVGWSVSNP